MITLTYRIPTDKKAEELDWLRSQKIFPGCEDYCDWVTQKMVVRVGVIVNPEQATAIKLRHKLDSQETYRK